VFFDVTERGARRQAARRLLTSGTAEAVDDLRTLAEGRDHA
jgi:hypothetical protein